MQTPHQKMLHDTEAVANWLFERAPEGYFGQLAFGRATKVATIWLPGNRATRRPEILIRDAAIGGCTQRCYTEPLEPMRTQQCFVCWVGLDLDDPIAESDEVILQVLGSEWSLRCSHGGAGRHAIARLAAPIPCMHPDSMSIVKQITAPYVARLNAVGVEVCKADCRVFWFAGGAQTWIHQSPDFITPAIVAPTTFADAPTKPIIDLSALKPGIAEWARRFYDAGCLKSLDGHHPCYLVECLDVLKAHGERTRKTKSSCRPTSGAYLDLTADRIQLWVHADGKVIWSYEEPDL